MQPTNYCIPICNESKYIEKNPILGICPNTNENKSVHRFVQTMHELKSNLHLLHRRHTNTSSFCQLRHGDEQHRMKDELHCLVKLQNTKALKTEHRTYLNLYPKIEQLNLPFCVGRIPS